MDCLKLSTLLTGSALATLLIAYPATAQTAPAPAPADAATAEGDTRFNGTADQGSQDIVVTGGRLSANGVTGNTPGGGLMAVQTGTKLRSTVTRDYIDKQLATANVFTVVKSLPGVVLANQDPFGHSSALSIRGLSQTSLGFNFEGMPAGDQLSYSAFPEEWGDTENIGRVNLTRGSTDITAPVYNSVGALLQEELIMPSREMGGYASASIGNHGLHREFLRLETGDIGNTGIRGFVSGSESYQHNWRGPGRSERHHVDSKFVKEWDDGSKVTLVATYNEESFDRYRNPTLAQWNLSKTSFNFNPGYTVGDVNSIKLRIGDRQSVYASAPSEFHLTDALTLNVTPYFLYTHGIINGASSLNTATAFYGTQAAGPLGVPAGTTNPVTVMNVDQYDQKTFGQNSFLAWNTGNSQIRLGYWYSHFKHREKAAFEIADANGHVSDPYGRDNPVLTSSGGVLRNFDATINQNVHGVYIDDTIKLLDDKLLINVGFKQVWIDRVATSPLPGTNQRTHSSNSKPLPQASIRYSFDDRNQVFADATTAFRAPSAVSSYVNIYNVATGAPSSVALDKFKAEYAFSQEIGYRYHGLVNFQVAGFNYKIKDRLVQGSQIVNGTSVGFAVNVGTQTARGIEAELGLNPIHGFSPYVSGQYLDSAKVKDDYPVRGTFLPTTGNRAVLSPKWVSAAGISYDDGHLFGSVEGNYVSSQYSTFMNDERLPSFEYANVSLGYRFGTIGFAYKPQIQFNVMNVTNKKYLSGIQGVSSNALATTARNGTVIAGTSPTYNVGGGRGFSFTLSSGF
jgi:iron complex outermembrane receptor protein